MRERRVDYLFNSVLPVEPQDCQIEIRNQEPSLSNLFATAWQSKLYEEVRGRTLLFHSNKDCGHNETDYNRNRSLTD